MFKKTKKQIETEEINLQNIKDTFNFLVDKAWFLANYDNYYYRSGIGSGSTQRCEDIDIGHFLISDKPAYEEEEYQEIIMVTDPRVELEYAPLHYSTNFCAKDHLAQKMEIAQYLSNQIAFLINKKDIHRFSPRTIKILQEYAYLVADYESKVKDEYNSKSEDEKRELVRENFEVINYLNNPSPVLKKMAYINYEKRHHRKNSDNNYFLDEYNKTLSSVLDRINNSSDLKCSKIKLSTEEQIPDLIYLIMMDVNPLCVVEIMKNERSKKVVTKALEVLPEMLLLSKWNKNAHHLVLNPVVVSILSSYNIPADLFVDAFGDTCIKVLEANHSLALKGNQEAMKMDDIVSKLIEKFHSATTTKLESEFLGTNNNQVKEVSYLYKK